MRSVSRSQFEVGNEFQVLHLGVNSLEIANLRSVESTSRVRTFLPVFFCEGVGKTSVQFKVLHAGLKVLQTAFKVLQTALKVVQMVFKVLQKGLTNPP
jgi:hypothetical protein